MRGRKARFSKVLFDYDFLHLSKTEPHARTRQRFLGLSHLQDGKTITKVAEICKVTRTSIRNWLDRLELEGLEGLREKKGRGAPSKLAYDQHENFKNSVLELQHNRAGGRIRGGDILLLMKEKFGIDCCIDTVYKTLSRIGIVWITSRSVHPKADKEKQEEFKKNFEIL